MRSHNILIITTTIIRPLVITAVVPPVDTKRENDTMFPNILTINVTLSIVVSNLFRPNRKMTF
jgi:hypothetical protein